MVLGAQKKARIGKGYTQIDLDERPHRKKRFFGCDPDNGPKSLYAAPLPDRIVCDTDSIGLRSIARNRL